MIRNIIFDWSGTLVNDLPPVLEASNHVFKLAGVKEMTVDEFRAQFCLPFKQFYDRIIPHIDLPTLEKWFHERFNQIQDAVEVMPHAIEFLEFCKSRQIKTFLLSSIREDHFREQSTRTNLKQYLNHIYVGVWDKRKKIQEIITQHNLNKNETLFIGDMQHDIETAKIGGIFSCAVLTGYNQEHQLVSSAPDLIVKDLKELQSILIANNLELPTRLKKNINSSRSSCSTSKPADSTEKFDKSINQQIISDQIIIDDLQLQYKVGTLPKERTETQSISVSLIIETDLTAAANTDDLTKTINYQEITQLLENLGQNKHWHLIETLASDIANEILTRFEVYRVTVLVKKFAIPNADFVAVKISRQKHAPDDPIS